MRFSPAFAVVPFIAAVIPLSVHAAAFSDVYEQHPYAEALLYVKEANIAGGFGDGTFRPDRTINRAEALKLIVSAAIDDEQIERCVRERGMVYDDVSRSDWFAPFVCSAEEKGILDASTQKQFRPADKITIAEVSAMLTRAFSLQKSGEAVPWFAPFVRALGTRNTIPAEVASAGERVTRGQIAEMIWRLQKDVRDRESADTDSLIEDKCRWFEAQNIPSVDDEEITRQWFNWINEERERQDLVPYTYDKQLSHTAYLWSERAAANGAITHKRDGQAAYYDYKMITKWFDDLGLAFKNNSGITFTENIGWGVYRCSATDCTAKLTDAIRTTFDMYMKEKTQQSRPHYNSMVNDEFTRMGLGLYVDSSSGKYYLTAHYATEITSDPQPLCP